MKKLGNKYYIKVQRTADKKAIPQRTKWPLKNWLVKFLLQLAICGSGFKQETLPTVVDNSQQHVEHHVQDMNVALYKVSLCMGISDDIKVIAVTLNETTILEIKVMISLPFQSNLTKLVGQFRAFVLLIKPDCFWIFSFPSSLWLR